MRAVFVIAILAVSVMASLPTNIPEPGELIFFLNEDDFEDYLDFWLKQSYKNISQITPRSGNIYILFFSLDLLYAFYVRNTGK